MTRFYVALGLSVISLFFLPQAQTVKQKPPETLRTASLPEKASAQIDLQHGDNLSDQIVRVTIATSRPDVTTSGTFGIYADLQNLASEPITLYPRETTLVVQPEVAHDPNCVLEFDGFFPTELSMAAKSPLGVPIVILPKEHYQVFWGLGGDIRCSDEPTPDGVWPWLSEHWTAFKSFIGFLPGTMHLLWWERLIYPKTTNQN